MKTLTSIQEAAVQEIIALRVQSPRSMAYGITLLNRSRRGLTRVRKQFYQDAQKLGFNGNQVLGAWADVRDMAVLEEGAQG